jgi:hypothetical protein
MMYEPPSFHLDLARQRHADFIREADEARLASQVERGPSETLAALRSILTAVRGMLTGRRPEIVRQPQLAPTA